MPTKMKKIFNIALSAVLGISLSGCDDFLTLVPLNDVVLENFWTDKADVESVLLGVYSAMEKSDCITRMSMWGEMRSDNIVASSTAGNDLTQVIKDNILETNSLTTWSCFYDVINRANTVLEYAPEVAKKDPNYTDADLRGHLAEAYTLRALSYFYLIRAYRDVPYVTRPSKDDEETFFIGVTSFDEILSQLIQTLEEISPAGGEWAVNRYKELGDVSNTSRITRVSVWALLADMYLWKASREMPNSGKSGEQVNADLCAQDLAKCVEYCDKVIARKVVDYKEFKDKQGADCTIELYNDIPLIKESLGSTATGTAYNEIFGTGNSYESLFELAFMPNQSVANSFVANYYGSENSSSGNLAAYSQLYSGAKENANKYFKKCDSRWMESMAEGSSSNPIRKYVRARVECDVVSQTASVKDNIRNSQQHANWIIYRLTDVVLMKAEAKVMQAMLLGTETVGNPEIEALLHEAFDCVNAVYQRAVNINGATISADNLLSYDTFAGSMTSAEEAVLLERRRELLFEGKRWFDLVRMCERDGNTRRLVSWVLIKHTENQSAIRIKLADMDAIYFPISKDELKINTLLKQNPAYIEDEFISKN